MTRATLQALLGAVLVLTVLALAGCSKRTEAVKSTEEAGFTMDVFTDRQTGCQYIGMYEQTAIPRIAADGKTHMGCKAVQP